MPAPRSSKRQVLCHRGKRPSAPSGNITDFSERHGESERGDFAFGEGKEARPSVRGWVSSCGGGCEKLE